METKEEKKEYFFNCLHTHTQILFYHCYLYGNLKYYTFLNILLFPKYKCSCVSTIFGTASVLVCLGAIRWYTRLSGLTKDNVFFHSSGNWNSSKVTAFWVSSDAFVFGLEMSRRSSPCVSIWPFLHLKVCMGPNFLFLQGLIMLN